MFNFYDIYYIYTNIIILLNYKYKKQNQKRIL